MKSGLNLAIEQFPHFHFMIFHRENFRIVDNSRVDNYFHHVVFMHYNLVSNVSNVYLYVKKYTLVNLRKI